MSITKQQAIEAIMSSCLIDLQEQINEINGCEKLGTLESYMEREFMFYEPDSGTSLENTKKQFQEYINEIN